MNRCPQQTYNIVKHFNTAGFSLQIETDTIINSSKLVSLFPEQVLICYKHSQWKKQ